jgi:hypothetical protein
MTESKRMNWVVHVASMGHMRNEYRILFVGPKRERPGEDLDLYGRILVKWNFR